MVCFRYIIVNTLHKGNNKDDDTTTTTTTTNNNNNNKCNHTCSTLMLHTETTYLFSYKYSWEILFILICRIQDIKTTKSH